MLGWSPEAALITPIPWLQLALEGVTDREMRRNGKEPPDRRHGSKPRESNRIKVQQQIKVVLGGRARAQARRRQSGRPKAGRENKAKNDEAEPASD
ncbi:MAG: hypothetical protein U5L06_00655 [Rhodovibrio sp.]|nr:hypothetical protein [Rhodovibrio sp.]